MSKPTISYLPSYYLEVAEFVHITNTEDVETNSLVTAVNDTYQQFHPETATWGLARWEKDLKIATLLSKPIEQRRSVVISKMRGSGKVSASMIKNVAESYDGGTVEVEVYPSEYRMKITFVDTMGIPPNIKDLMEAIEVIKPAHLSVEYEYSYLTWDTLESKLLTWDQLEDEGMTWDQLEVWK